MPFRSVALSAGPTSQIHHVTPDDLPCPIVLANHPISFVANEVVAIRKLAGHSGVTMVMRLLHCQGHFVENRTCLINLDDPPVAAFRDHGPAIFKPLKSVHLYWTCMAWLGLRLVLPNDLLG